jgi:hypothetical protein
MPLPTQDLRSNLGTWAVCPTRAPAVAFALTQSLPREVFDPNFQGQWLETTYFDTPDFDLRKVRKQGDEYLTLRVRCYGPSDAYALAAKTESVKFRVSIDPGTADALLAGNTWSALQRLMPPDLADRLNTLASAKPVVPVVKVCFRRFAVEDDTDRLTFDLGTETDNGKCLPFSVLEFKSTLAGAQPPPALTSMNLRPIKLSKFLWATRV